MVCKSIQVLAGQYKTRSVWAAILMLHWCTKKKKETGVKDQEAVLGAPAKSHQPSSAESLIDFWGWTLAEFGSGSEELVYKSFLEQDYWIWILILNATQPSQLVLATSGHNPHFNITKVYGSESPKPSFSWSRACVSVCKKKK